MAKAHAAGSGSFRWKVSGLLAYARPAGKDPARRQTRVMLLLDAIAPLTGAGPTLLFHVPDQDLLIYLGAFAGFLLSIGANDILPEGHADHPSLATYGLTVAGTGLMYAVTGVLR
jgi:zinc transporter, ZIP family